VDAKTKRKRCRAGVYHRDTYRRIGRGKSGFSMHYTREQCTRAAKADGRCWQHPHDGGVLDAEWAQEFIEE